MRIRWVPLAQKIGRADPAQVDAVIQTITASLSPSEALKLVEHKRSLWLQFLSPNERMLYCEMARPHRGVVRKIAPDDVWNALETGRPDLHAALSRNGGHEWLLIQAAEIKAALLQAS